MKTKILSLLTLIVLALGLTACHEDITPGNTSSEQGSINLRSMGVEINNAEKVIASSRSRAGIDLSDYLIEIYNSDKTLVANWKYSEMPELFSLPVGSGYTVKVRSHEVQKAEWEKPYFYGEQSFDIASDEITEIGVVTCSLANVKVTVDFTDDLRKVMGDDCVVTVNANDEGELQFTADETRAGYFAFVEGSTTLTAVFTGTVQGNQESLTFTATDLEAGQYRKITFSLTGSSITKPEETGTVTIEGINLSASVEKVDLTDGKITIEEDDLGSNDRPGQQDPETGDDDNNNSGDDNQGGTDDSTPAATFTCPTASFTEPNYVSSYGSNPSVIVNINAPNGIRNLIVSINTTSTHESLPDESFEDALTEFNIPLTFDLAYPGSNADAFSGLGLPVGDQVINQTSVDFDISQFVPLLNLYEGTHTFKITVNDNSGNTSSTSLTFIAG